MSNFENIAVLPVNDVYVSIQGEGALAGTPMVVTRLQGCAVGCHFCDTKETWKVNREFEVLDLFGGWSGKNDLWRFFPINELVDYINLEILEKTLWSGDKWILLTGGEPADYNLTEFVSESHRAGFKVALETSGTADGHMTSMVDWVTVSPKINNPAGIPLKLDVIESADEIKFVIGGLKDKTEMFNLLSKIEITDQIVSVQPMSKGDKSTQLCLEICKEYGYRLSLQLHKYLDIP